MVSANWLNAGAGFNLSGPSTSTGRKTSQATVRSSSARPSQSRAKPKETQRRLRPLDKKSLVTPRASSSAPKPTQQQSKLVFAPQLSNQRRPLADKDNCRDSGASSSSADRDRKGKGPDIVPDSQEIAENGGDDAPAVPERKGGWLNALFRRNPSKPGESSSSSDTAGSRAPRSTGFGRAVINPTQRRRGTTIEFDSDLPADEDDLEGEDDRRKRRKTEDRDGWGRLDLCDEDVHAGFGTQPSGRSERAKRSLEMVLDGAEGGQMSTSGRTRTREPRDGPMKVRPDSQGDDQPSQRLTTRAPASSRMLVLPSSPGSDAEPSTASSGSSAERSLQTRLVQPAKSAPRILVPDSDPPSEAEADLTEEQEEDEDDEEQGDVELDGLVVRLGQRGAVGIDDSGFAEGGMDIDVRECTPSPAGGAAVDLTVVPSSSPLPAPALLGVPLADDKGSRCGGSLGRTASGILMPPPAVPRKRLRRGAPSTRAAAEATEAKRPRVLVEDTQVRSPSRAATFDADADADAESLPYVVVCDETQTQPPEPVPAPHYRTLPRLPRPANLAGAGVLSSPSAAAALSSDPDHLPPLPTPRPLAVPLPLPNRNPIAIPAALASAWVGARPPSPAAPRQTHLGEFFSLTCVPSSQADSQPPLGGVGEAERALEEAVRLQRAVNGRRERVVRLRGMAEVEEEEEIDEADRDEAEAEGEPGEGQEEGQVPDSDPEEDNTPAPLDTPTGKARFPRYSPGKLRRAVERLAGGDEPVVVQQEGEAEVEEETQWESYWSYPASSPASRAAGAQADARADIEGGESEEEDDDEETLALPAGWGRGPKGELVRIAAFDAAYEEDS